MSMRAMVAAPCRVSVPVSPPRGIVPEVSSTQGPLLVFGPRSLAYDFGPAHPLTPRRFGPGHRPPAARRRASPASRPAPPRTRPCCRVHLPAYVAAVRRLSADPAGPGAMGIGLADNPAFAGMHEAAASVAGGSLAAMEAILARPTRSTPTTPAAACTTRWRTGRRASASTTTPALAVVRARAEGLRVLYVDLDVHHGDGVQALDVRGSRAR